MTSSILAIYVAIWKHLKASQFTLHLKIMFWLIICLSFVKEKGKDWDFIMNRLQKPFIMTFLFFGKITRLMMKTIQNIEKFWIVQAWNTTKDIFKSVVWLLIWFFTKMKWKWSTDSIENAMKYSNTALLNSIFITWEYLPNQ